MAKGAIRSKIGVAADADIARCVNGLAPADVKDSLDVVPVRVEDEAGEVILRICRICARSVARLSGIISNGLGRPILILKLIN